MAEPFTVLLGCGGHGRVVLDSALCAGLSVGGIVDGALAPDERVMGVPVLGGDEWLAGTQGVQARLLLGVGANPDTARRRQLVQRWGAGRGFAAVLHPAATLSAHATLGEGVQVLAGAVVQAGTRLGAPVVRNTGARVDHDCRLGDFAFIAPGAVLCGAVEIGEGAFVGAGAVLLPGMKVGAGAVVGAAALVNRDVPAGSVVAGVPAVQLGARN